MSDPRIDAIETSTGDSRETMSELRGDMRRDDWRYYGNNRWRVLPELAKNVNEN